MNRSVWLFFVVLLLPLTLLACQSARGGEASAADATPTFEAPPVAEETDPTEEPAVDEMPTTEAPSTADGDCLSAETGTLQLIDPVHGLCFLYPDTYDAYLGDANGYTLYVDSLLNTEAPIATVTVTSAEGRALNDIVAEMLIATTLPEGSMQEITVAGQPAIQLDNMPGQDINRRLFLIHEDQLIDIMVGRIGPEYGEVGEQAEALWTMIVDTLRLTAIDPAGVVQAGPECPAPQENTTIYTNEVAGYCMLIPAEYQIIEVSGDPDNNEMAFYVTEIQDPAHAKLFINVSPANGLMLEEVTAAVEQEVESAMGEDIVFSFGYMLDGEFANRFDQLPGQDFSRQLVMVHNDRLFKLTFIPDDEAAGTAYEEMEVLYEMVVDTFSFLAE